MIEDFDIIASRAVKPLFSRAPYPEGFGYQPREYQHAGVEYCVSRANSMIGDAPGVGKTTQAICISNLIQAKHTLVVCPASLRLNWQREILAWSTIENAITYVVGKSKDGVSLQANYVIISYDLLSNKHILEAILDQNWDHVILDEAHAIKDPKGNKRTRVICAPDMLPSATGRFTLLSGTILPNQPIEAYNAIRLLNWETINRASLDSFREYYYDYGSGMIRGPVFNPETQTWANKLHWSDKVRNKPRNLEDFQYRLRKNLMVRRLKEDVLHELPKKQWHLFPISITPEIKQALAHPSWSVASKLYELDPEAFESSVPIDGQIATARRLLGEAKAPVVAEYIRDLIQGGVQKVVVSAYHLNVLKYLRESLQENHGLVYMDGSTSSAAKQEAVDRFQSDDKVQIILGQVGPLGLGWTLTAAQDAVLAEFDWVPSINDQLLDRIHRFGQKGNHVIGHVPIIPGSLDEKLINTAVTKDRYIYQALDHTS